VQSIIIIPSNNNRGILGEKLLAVGLLNVHFFCLSSSFVHFSVMRFLLKHIFFNHCFRIHEVFIMSYKFVFLCSTSYKCEYMCVFFPPYLLTGNLQLISGGAVTGMS
jgi:hypothetical protein